MIDLPFSALEVSDHTREALERYRDAFRPSRWSAEPRVLVCGETVCADTEERAAEFAGSMDVIKVGLLAGRGESAFPTPADAAGHRFDEAEQEALAAFVGQQARSVNRPGERATRSWPPSTASPSPPGPTN